jgi:hypothetical protein
MFNMGTISINEIRSLENLNKISENWAEEHWLQLNMATASSLATESPDDTPEPRALCDCGVEHTHEPRKDIEIRQVPANKKRLAVQRSRVAMNYEKRFTIAAQKMVVREGKDLREASKELIDDVELKKWINGYYNEQKTIDRMFSAMQPSFQAMGSDINVLAAKEVDTEEDISGTKRFVNGYTNRAVLSHAAINADKFNKVVTRAVADDADIEEAMILETEKMEETQANRFGFEHITALSCAVAKMRFKDGGVTKLQWVTLGGKTCPYCQSYEGLIVGIEENFANSGDGLFPEDEDHTLTQKSAVSYAPLHGGCVCQVAPV